VNENEDELGERSDCDACGLAFWVVANNDAEIMLEGLKVEFCPRCGTRIDE
jgi:ribosomal protein S27AE